MRPPSLQETMVDCTESIISMTGEVLKTAEDRGDIECLEGVISAAEYLRELILHADIE